MGQSILHRALSAQSTDAKPTSYLTILALEDGLTAKLSDSTIYYRINTGTQTPEGLIPPYTGSSVCPATYILL